MLKHTKFSEEVLSTIAFLKKTANAQLNLIENKDNPFNQITRKITSEQILYLENFETGVQILDELAEDINQKDEVLKELLFLIVNVPEWRYDYHLTDRESIQHLAKASSHIRKAISEIRAAPNVRMNCQSFWEDRIRALTKVTNLPNEKIELDFLHTLNELCSSLDEGIKYHETRNVGIKKPRGSEAYLQYFVLEFQKILIKHEINTRKHVRFICELLNDIIQPEDYYSEDRIRKLFQSKSGA